MYFVYGEKELTYLRRKDRRLSAAIDRIGHVDRAVDTDLFSSVVHHIVGQQISISQKKDELQQLKNELKEQQVVNDELRYDLNEENADNTDYAEKVARRELDYVKPGERVFYNVGGNN